MSNQASAAAPAVDVPPRDELALTLERALKAWRFGFEVEDELRALQARNHVEGVHNINIAPHTGFWQERRRLAEDLVEDLIAGMKRAFLPDGFDLSVSTYGLSDRNASFRDDEDRAGDFLRYAERVLRETYQGCGERLALSQAAAVIWNAFDLETRSEVKPGPGGTVCLDARVWLEKSMRGGRRLSHTSESRVYHLWQALGAFLVHVGRPGLYPSTQRLLSRFSAHDVGVVSRGTYRIFEGITLVTFYERFEYRFDPAIAADLQVFLAEYRAEQDG